MSNTRIRRYAAAAAFAALAAGQLGAAGPVHDARPAAAAAVRAAVANAAPLSCAMSVSALAGGLRERTFAAQSATNFAMQTRQVCDEVRH
jgi:hypothetical protein